MLVNAKAVGIQGNCMNNIVVEDGYIGHLWQLAAASCHKWPIYPSSTTILFMRLPCIPTAFALTSVTRRVEDKNSLLHTERGADTMRQESALLNDRPNDRLTSLPPILDGSPAFEGMEEVFEVIAAGLYSLASMLVGEGEQR